MRADRSGSSSSPVSNIVYAAAGRRGRDFPSTSPRHTAGPADSVSGGSFFSNAMNREVPLARAAEARPTHRVANPARARDNGRVILPPHAPGMRIGLFGGTFDPPHAAHRAACLLAMRRLELD